MREITVNEISKLNKCLQSLSEYHNEVSNYFKGSYPSRPYEDTLKYMKNMDLRKMHVFLSITGRKILACRGGFYVVLVENRVEYLKGFDDTVLYSVSYAIVGTLIIRTSYLLSDKGQYDLTDAITKLNNASKLEELIRWMWYN